MSRRNGRQNMDKVKQSGRAMANAMGNASSETIWKWVKVILMIVCGIGLIWIAYTVIKSLKNGVSGFFENFKSTTIGSLLTSVTGDTSGSSGGGGSEGSSNGSSNTGKPWRPIVDEIYEKLNGPNAMVYPEVVNKLAHLTNKQVKYAAYYWHGTYRTGTGYRLYDFIAGEWTWNNPYSAALGALTDAGVGA